MREGYQSDETPPSRPERVSDRSGRCGGSPASTRVVGYYGVRRRDDNSRGRVANVRGGSSASPTDDNSRRKVQDVRADSSA
jgi:hypothetical protein